MQIIVNYRVDPKVAAALLPAQFRPRIVNGHAVGGLLVRDDTVEYRIAVESGAYLLNSETGPLLAEELPRQVYASFAGEDVVDVSVRPAVDVAQRPVRRRLRRRPVRGHDRRRPRRHRLGPLVLLHSSRRDRRLRAPAPGRPDVDGCSRVASS